MRLDNLRQKIAKREAARAWDRKQARHLESVRGMLERAAVDSRHLTDTPEWDAYLQRIEVLNERDCKLLEELQAVLEDPFYMTAEQCQKNHFQIAVLIAAIRARNECIEIPKQLQGAADALDHGS